jgi:hypothetical protein
MIQYGDHVDDHENIRVRVRGRGQNPWSTQQKKSERTPLKFSTKFSTLFLAAIKSYFLLQKNNILWEG